MSCTQLGVSVAAATIGTQKHLLAPGEASALMFGALLTIACTSIAGTVAARAQSAEVGSARQARQAREGREGRLALGSGLKSVGLRKSPTTDGHRITAFSVTDLPLESWRVSLSGRVAWCHPHLIDRCPERKPSRGTPSAPLTGRLIDVRIKGTRSAPLLRGLLHSLAGGNSRQPGALRKPRRIVSRWRRQSSWPWWAGSVRSDWMTPRSAQTAAVMSSGVTSARATPARCARRSNSVERRRSSSTRGSGASSPQTGAEIPALATSSTRTPQKDLEASLRR